MSKNERRPRQGLAPWTVLVAVALAGCAGCSGGEESTEAARQRGHDGQGKHAGEEEHEPGVVRLAPEAVETIGLRTAAVERRPLAAEIRATAVIEPNEYALAHVSPRIAGRAIRVWAVLGEEVEEGDVLAELDSIELGQKKAAFLKAKASLDVVRRDFDREKRLFGKKISSEKEFLDAKGEFERAQATYRAAREALRLVGLSDGAIDEIRWGGKEEPLSHFPLVAPFGGTVIERHITLGELITPEEKRFTIADLSTVWILLNVYEKDLARVRVGQAVRIQVDSFPGETFEGTVTYLASVLDSETRTAEARVEVPNADRRLRPGMFARAVVAMPDEESLEALVVPEEAIQRTEGRKISFVAEGEGAYRMREVEVGRRVDGAVEIRSGLEEGERIVTQGAFYLKSELEKEKTDR